MFYCLIAGSRDFEDYETLKRFMDALLRKQTEVTIVSGGARGADTLAERYAKEKGYGLKVFPADWEKFGKSAGYIRNKQMHEFIAEYEKRGCVLFWDGKSRGTKQNIELCEQYHNELRIVYYKTKKIGRGAESHESLLEQEKEEK